MDVHRRAAARDTALSRTSRRARRGSLRRRRFRTPRRRESPAYFASTTIFIKPAVSPFSRHGPRGSSAASRPGPNGRGAPGLRFGEAGAAERRVDVERVGRNAIRYPPGRAVEQVGRDDLEIVVRRVREGAFAVAVAQRPDPRDVRLQLVVHDDVAALVARPRRPLRARDRRCSAGGRPRAARAIPRLPGCPSAQSTSTTTRPLIVVEADAARVQAHRDALARRKS